ncbi:TPA: phage tail protein, partial [Providencia alcalifaciens]
MLTKHTSILTQKGQILEAASVANGRPVLLKQFVIGDGNGRPVIPSATQTQLVHEVYRGTISSLEVSPEQPNQFIAHLVLPEGVGDFVVREVGLLTAEGELYAVGSCSEIEKPRQGVTVRLQFRLAVSESAQITLQVATGDGLFLRQDANLQDVKDKSRAIDNLGLRATVDKANNAVPSERQVNGQPLSQNITITTITGNAGSATKLQTARNINGLAFDGTKDIHITTISGNAGSATKLQTARNINGVAFDGTKDIHITTISGNAGSATKLQTARKINGVAFDGTQDITISAGNVGSYSKLESDARYVQGIRLGAKTRYSPSGNRVSWNWEAPAGNVLTGLVVDETGSNSADNISGAWYRPLQSLVNGQW